MNSYKVTGESRQVGAIGIFEPFIENIVAESSKEAYDKVRKALYAQNREHVHVKSIHVTDDGDNWTLVEPRAYI